MATATSCSPSTSFHIHILSTHPLGPWLAMSDRIGVSLRRGKKHALGMRYMWLCSEEMFRQDNIDARCMGSNRFRDQSQRVGRGWPEWLACSSSKKTPASRRCCCHAAATVCVSQRLHRPRRLRPFSLIRPCPASFAISTLLDDGKHRHDRAKTHSCNQPLQWKDSKRGN